MNRLKHQNYKNENTETKNFWYDWLINYIPKIIKQTVAGVKDNFMSLFKTNITENYSKPKRVNNVYGGRKKPRKPKIKKTQKTT